jgi:hypothetical protein
MKETNNLLNALTKQVDDAVESLLIKLESQDAEIIHLKRDNERLKNDYIRLVEEIKQYIIELEQIKSHYVDSNHNSK